MKLRNKKTGEIQNPNSIVITDDSEKDGVFVFRSIEQLVEEYEDYKPKEPLIKDKEIRRAVRGLGFTKVCFVSSSSGLTWRAYDYEFNSAFELIIKTKPFDECKDGNVYYITDLCGEEKE